MDKSAGEAPGAAEKILLVEDHDAVRMLTRRFLEDLGYTVTDAPGPPEALALCSDADTHFDLLLSDISMPVMTGDELARQVRTLRPGIAVVLVTGASAKPPGETLLRKPFKLDELERTLRRALDDRPPAGGSA